MIVSILTISTDVRLVVGSKFVGVHAAAAAATAVSPALVIIRSIVPLLVLIFTTVLSS